MKGTKREAEALLVRLLHQRENGIDAPPGRLTVAEYLQRWLSVHVQPNTAPKTFRRYEQIARVHLLPVIGGIPLTKLRPLHIQEVYTQVLKKGVSARTALHCHRVLREAPQHALKWQMLSRNPADAVEAPRPLRKEMHVLSPDGVQKLLAACRDLDVYTLAFLAIASGLRLGEILALRWEDIDLDGGSLRVTRTLQSIAGRGLAFREPKTACSRRRVSLSQETVPVLREHRRRQLERRLALGPAYKDHGLVFAGPLGEPVPPYSVSQRFARLVRNSGVGPLRFHDLRHTNATLMLMAGVHVKIVSERLGHSGVAITLDTYSHVLPGIQEEAANVLDRYLRRPAR